MEEMYREYSIMPGPNDPGLIIRDDSPPRGQIVGVAPTYYDARAWIDNLIDGPPVSREKRKT